MKYIIEFSKTGTICYTSHLDIMKVFKRAFKKVGIGIAYSQGFNPHPKMGFAQPLSLGYWGLEEYVEFETVEESDPEEMLSKLSAVMPEGLVLKRILQTPWLKKTLAAENVAAEYLIEIPVGADQFHGKTSDEIRDAFMAQDEILAWKKKKKKPEPVQVNIKNGIQSISIDEKEGLLYLNTVLDSGSESNVSPELLIASFKEFFDIDVSRADINVARKRLLFKDTTEQYIHG